jgi:nucleotide-binding universal stress UspA family protein
MFEEVIACLDGSSLAETILPLAHGLAASKSGKLTLLRIVADAAELAVEEDYLRDCARQYNAELRYLVAADPAEAIVAEIDRSPNAIAALTTHGRTAWAEAILGSVALRVVGEAKRPVVVFRPLDESGEAPNKITSIIAALDGSEFAERIIPYAAKAALSLSAQLTLVQVLAVGAPAAALENHRKSDISESTYLHWQAGAIKKTYGIAPEWEVLHGEPAQAICQYVKRMPNAMLALTTHARRGVKLAVLGSVAAECTRHAGVPLLLYWPHH